MVPLLLNYLSKGVYGLWVTLISLVGWILISDFGIGYGFRNRVTEYLADNDKEKLTSHFATTFQYYLIITFLLIIVFTIALFTNPFLIKHRELALAIYIPYLVYFPFSIGNQILQGLRLVYINNILNLVRAVLWACAVFFALFFVPKSDIKYIAISYTVVNSFANFLTIFLALRKSKLNLPSISTLLARPKFDASIVVGIKFFVLQISTLLLFSMGNYFVYSNLTPSDTANYDTINKVYSLSMTFFNIVIAVYWSEISLFRAKQDFFALRKIYSKLLLFATLYSISSVALSYCAPFLVDFWTNGRIQVTVRQSLPFSFLVSLQAIAYSGSVFLNAFEKLMPQVIISLLSILAIYPLIKIGFSNKLGIGTIPIISGILVIPSVIVCHYVALKLIKQKATLLNESY